MSASKTSSKEPAAKVTEQEPEAPKPRGPKPRRPEESTEHYEHLSGEAIQHALRKEFVVLIARESELKALPSEDGGPSTRFTVSEPFGRGGPDSVGWTRGVGKVLHEAQQAQPIGRGWRMVGEILNDVLHGGLDATADLTGYLDPAELETNTLSALGNLVSKAFRRRVLLQTLQGNRWNLSQTAMALRIPGGSSPVARMIRELDLQAEYDAALAADPSLRARGGRPRKTA